MKKTLLTIIALSIFTSAIITCMYSTAHLFSSSSTTYTCDGNGGGEDDDPNTGNYYYTNGENILL